MNFIFINHFHTQPLYRQLKQSIKNAIIQGILKHLDPLPSEHALTSTFSISSTVVKKAYYALEQENFIRRIQGKGTFVHYPRKIKIPYPFPFFLHHAPFTTQPYAILDATKNLINASFFDEHQRLTHLKQSLYANSQLFGYQEVWFPFKDRSLFINEDHHFQLKPFILKNFTMYQPFSLQSQTTFSLANEEQAAQLHLQPNDPIIIIHSTMLYQQKTIGIGISYIKGDHSHVEWEERK